LGFNDVGVVEELSIMISLHSSAGSLDVLTVVQQNVINFGIVIGNFVPIVEDAGGVDKGSVG